jgi:F-type H+-transporting ATPase subunit b
LIADYLSSDFQESLLKKLVFNEIMFVLAFAEGGGIQLVPDGTIFVHIALILLMIWILNRTLFRPINRILASREKNTGGRSGEANQILNQVADKEIAYNNNLRDVRTESYELIEAQRGQAVAVRQGRLDAVKNEIVDLVSREKIGVETQFGTAKNDLAKDAEKLAEKISSNILKTA